MLAKLFNTILYGRLQALVQAKLSEEQYGFSQGRGGADAAHIFRMVVEKSAEWGEELWVAALDSEEAFVDRVHHSNLFNGLPGCCE